MCHDCKLENCAEEAIPERCPLYDVALHPTTMLHDTDKSIIDTSGELNPYCRAAKTRKNQSLLTVDYDRTS